MQATVLCSYKGLNASGSSGFVAGFEAKTAKVKHKYKDTFLLEYKCSNH